MPVKVVDNTSPDDTPPPPASDLARLRVDAETFSPKPLRYVHPTMPQYILVFRHDLDGEQMEAWRKRCVTRQGRNGRDPEIDFVKLNRMIVSGTMTSIELRENQSATEGRTMLDSRGDELSFTNREFLAEFGVATAADAVKAFIPSDPGIASLAAKLVEDNGVGADVEALPDPTDSAGS